MSQFIEMFGENNTVSLCDVAHIIMGSSPDSEYYNENGEGLPFYQGKTEFGDMYIKPAVTFCTKPVREADVNDILMSVRAPVGAVNIAQEHCCIGRGLSAIRAKSEKMTPLFLYYALKIKEDDIAALGTGSTFKAINKDVVYSIQIPASTMDDQQKFVAIAQQADKSKFVGFKSQFIEMFGSYGRMEKLANLCSVSSGKSIPTRLEDIKGGIAYVKVADFNLPGNENYIYSSQRYVTEEGASYSKMIPVGSVIFAKNGAASLSNKKRLTKIDCCIDMNTMAITSKSNDLNGEFLFAIIQAMDISVHVRQGAVPSISPKSIEECMIPLPTLAEQYNYISIVQQADISKYFS